MNNFTKSHVKKHFRTQSESPLVNGPLILLYFFLLQEVLCLCMLCLVTQACTNARWVEYFYFQLISLKTITQTTITNIKIKWLFIFRCSMLSWITQRVVATRWFNYRMMEATPFPPEFYTKVQKQCTRSEDKMLSLSAYLEGGMLVYARCLFHSRTNKKLIIFQPSNLHDPANHFYLHSQ